MNAFFNSTYCVCVCQLKRYFEPEQDLLPPLKLESCIGAHGDQVFLQEPLVQFQYFIITVHFNLNMREKIQMMNVS